MKYVIYALFLGAAFLFGFGVCYFRVFPYTQFRKGYESYRLYTNNLPKVTERKKTVHLVGDSLVRRGDWRKISDFGNYINHGVGGARLDDALQVTRSIQFQEDDRLFILVGLNDLNWEHSTVEFERTLTEFFEGISEIGVPVLISTIPEVPGNGNYDRRELIELMNFKIKENAVRFKFDLFEINDFIANELGVEQKFLSDSMHLSTSAYKPIIEAIKSNYTN